MEQYIPEDENLFPLKKHIDHVLSKNYFKNKFARFIYFGEESADLVKNQINTDISSIEHFGFINKADLQNILLEVLQSEDYLSSPSQNFETCCDRVDILVKRYDIEDYQEIITSFKEKLSEIIPKKSDKDFGWAKQLFKY